MTRHFANALAVLSATAFFLMCTGCGAFWDVSTTSSSTVTSTTLFSGYFYMLDSATSQIIVFEIESGTLTEIASYAPPSAPLAMAVAPDNDFLFVSTSDGIYSYTISDGALTLNTAAISSDPAVAMQVDADSEWLIETSATGYLYVIPVLASSGEADSSRSTAEVAFSSTTVNQIAVAPNDKYVFVACGTSGTLAFSFSPSSSDPIGSSAYATIDPVNTSDGAALSVAVDPSTRLLYIGESAATSSGGGLRAYTIGTSGALTALSDSPRYSGGTGPHAILPKSTGDYVYVANWNGTSEGNITGFKISDSDSEYTLTKLSSSVATGIEPMSLAEDSNENFILAASKSGSPYFDAYFFDSDTAGQLDTTIKSSSFAASSIAAQRY